MDTEMVAEAPWPQMIREPTETVRQAAKSEMAEIV